MRIGKSDRRIEIQRATETTNGYGEKVETWSELATVWAELMKTSGQKEAISNQQDTAAKTLTFKIRSSSTTRGITPKDRVIYSGDTFDIKGIDEIGRNDQLLLMCETASSTY